MDVTSSLGKVLARTVRLLRGETVDADLYRESHFENQELRKRNKELADNLGEARNRSEILTAHLTKAHQDVENFESEALASEERAALAVARFDGLVEEVGYLRDQIKIYQTRLGLLPQERQSEPGTVRVPLKRGREPFSVAQDRIQKERTEAYWRAKADAVDPTGTTGTTSTDSPTVSDSK